MAMTRRGALTGAGAMLAMASGAAAQSSRWEPPAAALAMPGYSFWTQPLTRRLVPMDARVTTAAGDGTLAALTSGKVTILSFWAPWCAPCLQEKPSLDDLAGRLAAARVRVTTISLLTAAVRGRYSLDVARAAHTRLNLRHLEPVVDTAELLKSPFTQFLNSAGTNPSGTPLPPPTNGTTRRLRLPRTLLLAPNGRELGRLDAAVSETAGRDVWRDPRTFAFLQALTA